MTDTDQTTEEAVKKGNGSLTFLWVLALAGLFIGIVMLATDGPAAAGTGLIGFGGLALLLALTVQAVRAPR